MSNLKTRVKYLEKVSTVGTVAGVLGGTAVVRRVEGGLFHLPSGEIVTEDQLHERLRGCSGHLLILGGWHLEYMKQ